VTGGREDGPSPAPPAPSPNAGSGSLLVSRLLVAIGGWAGTVVIARGLSSEGWGAYSFVFGLLGIVGMITDLQVGRIVLRGVLDADDRAGGVVGSYISFRFFVGLASLVLAIAFVLVGGYEAQIVVGTMIAGVGVVIGSVVYGMLLWFQARLWLRPVAVASAIGAAVQLALVLAVAAGPQSTLALFAGAWTVGQAAILLMQWWALRRRNLRFSLRIDLSDWWVWLKEAVPLAIGAGLATLYFKVDLVMLSKLDTLEAVGQYGIGYKFADIVSYVPVAVLTPVLTLMITAWPRDKATVRNHFRQVAVLFILGGVTLTVAFALVADPVVRLLYGERYAPSVDAARLLVAGAAIQFFSQLCFVTLVAVGRNRPYVLAGLTGLAINVALNLVLIPRYSFDGSASATVVTECVVLVVLVAALRRTRGIMTFPWAAAARIAVGATGMAVTYLLLDLVAPWPIAAAAAGVVFLALLHVLNIDGPGGLRAIVRHIRFEVAAPERP